MSNVGFDTFFPKQVPTVFRVKNICADGKRVRIFQYPIVVGDTRDLLEIPFVSEADIRHSLLKGELRIKLLAQEIIVVESNIDLLQFDSVQKEFLTSHGVNDGVEVPAPTPPPVTLPYSWRVGVFFLGATNGVNRTFTIPGGEKFVDGSLSGNDFQISVRHNGRGLVKDVDYIIAESGGVGTGYDSIYMTSFIPDITSNLWADYVVANP